MTKRRLLAVMICLMLIMTAGCGSKDSEAEKDNKAKGRGRTVDSPVEYRFASAEEGRDLMLSNKAYYDGFSQNDLDYRMERRGAGMDEYRKYAGNQTRDFTEEEMDVVERFFGEVDRTVRENGYDLPPLDEITIIKTTMKEEPGALAYTHGTQIYFLDKALEDAAEDEDAEKYIRRVLWHELFHCLTRCNPDFRKDMYRIIHFTVTDDTYKLPPSVFEYHISNPDVENHDSYATFRIDGEDVECFTDFITTEHFRNIGDTFFDTGTTALIPVDGSDVYYTPEQAENFDEIFGTNTDYVIDPEECMADNFSLAMSYGMEGEDGEGYPNPEIIEAIISNMKGNR